MQKRQLGKLGPHVGSVGLGCMSFAGFYGATDETEAHATLKTALDLGVDHLDTSNMYGNGVSETIIGNFVKNNSNRFKIATKAGIRTQPTRCFDNSPEHLRQSLEGSLKRLNVDFVDLFYIHRREQERPIEDVCETLVQFIQEGKIGGFGFSEISPSSLARANAVHHVMAVQSEYSLWTRLPELGMLQMCEKLGTAFVAFSPLARGMFSNQQPVPAAMPDNDFRKNQPRFTEPNFTFNSSAIKRFIDYARDHGWSPASLAIAWTLHQGDHIIPIPGTRSSAHLKDDAGADEIKLSAEQLAEIEAILPVGFAHGDRYSEAQYVGPERYC